MEVILHINPSIIIPIERLNPVGTKAGKKATAITAAFTLVRLVVIPVLNGVAITSFAIFEKSNLDEFLDNCLKP